MQIVYSKKRKSLHVNLLKGDTWIEVLDERIEFCGQTIYRQW